MYILKNHKEMYLINSIFSELIKFIPKPFQILFCNPLLPANSVKIQVPEILLIIYLFSIQNNKYPHLHNFL